MNEQRVNGTHNFDQRLNDWLEEGAQSVPDWLVEAALEQAHATPQVKPGFRVPWVRRRRTFEVDLGRLAPVLAGALGGMVVIGAFVLGLVSAPRVGDQQPTPTPVQTPTAAPASPAAGPIGGVQLVDVLPAETPGFYALIGLTATHDAVWTVVATDTSAGRLVRIDAVSGEARVITIPGAEGLLSPPVADGEVIWTASETGLHRVAATGEGTPVSLPLEFQPAEISPAPEGLWIAREGGTSLVDRETGQVLREIGLDGQSTTGRIIGGPLFDSLWTCPTLESVVLLDPADGTVRARADLPPNSSCHGRFVRVGGVGGLEQAVIPLLADVVLDPATAEVAAQLELRWSDVIDLGGRPLFLSIVPDPPGNLALVELDPDTLGTGSSYTLAGNLHLNTTFESGHLAVAGDYVWVLGAPRSGPGEQSRPQIMRVPLAELDQG